MDQAEKSLREVYLNSQQQQTLFKRKTRESKNANYKENNTFINDLDKYQHGSKQVKNEIINKYINPDKNTIYELSKDIINQKSNCLDQFQTSLNIKILEAMKEYIKIVEIRTKIEEDLKKTKEKKNDLKIKINEIKSSINKYTEETKEYTRKIEEIKNKEKVKILKLNTEIDSIRFEQGKAEIEKHIIQHELEEKMCILEKKNVELQKEKKINLNLSQEIKYYTEIIAYQNKLHNDIQP